LEGERGLLLSGGWHGRWTGAFLSGRADSRQIFTAPRETVRETGQADIRAMTSQIALRRNKAFAWAKVPSKYLREEVAPFVLAVALRRRDRSPRSSPAGAVSLM
jgi:hypothetical protein